MQGHPDGAVQIDVITLKQIDIFQEMMQTNAF